MGEQQQNQQVAQPNAEATQMIASQPVSQPIEPKKKSKWWLWAIIVFVLVLIGVGGWWYYVQGQAMLLVKDMEWKWGETSENYKMTYDVDLSLSQLDDNNSFIFDISNLRAKINGDNTIYGQQFAGQLNLDFSADENSFVFTLKNKKIDEVVYLQVSLPDDFSDLMPIDLNDTWIAVDQSTLEENSLYPTVDVSDYQSYLKAWNSKFNKFLTAAKEKRLLNLSDPHENKVLGEVNLKKINFNLNPEQAEDFMMTIIDNFVDPTEIEQVKKSFNDFKIKEPENWSNFQNFLSAIEFNLWLDTDTKNIFGLELSLQDFEMKSNGKATCNVSFDMFQMIENIAAQEITVPENILSMEELQSMMFGGSLPDDTMDSIDILEIFSVETANQFETGLNACFQAEEELTIPEPGEPMCNNVEGVAVWPELNGDYKWSEYIDSYMGFGTFEFCVYSDDAPGVTCTETGCFIAVCQENTQTDCIDGTECGIIDISEIDSDNDGLSDDMETLLFQTDPNNPDTDGDGYTDGEEVNNGYNPLGEGLLELE